MGCVCVASNWLWKVPYLRAASSCSRTLAAEAQAVFCCHCNQPVVISDASGSLVCWIGDTAGDYVHDSASNKSRRTDSSSAFISWLFFSKFRKRCRHCLQTTLLFSNASCRSTFAAKISVPLVTIARRRDSLTVPNSL